MNNSKKVQEKSYKKGNQGGVQVEKEKSLERLER